MIIQVTGTGTANKGAELLLIAVKQQIHKARPNASLAVTTSFGSFDERAQYGLRTVLPESPKGRWWLAGKMTPLAMRRQIGVVEESEVDAVLDASGFAFGDQLGAARSQAFAADVRRWKKQRKPVVLLPQALGPFEQPDVRNAFRDIALNVDLIFAREQQSFEHVAKLGVSSARVEIAPDFTNLVDFHHSGHVDRNYQSLLVPNYQMIAKAEPRSAENYVPFLARCYRQLAELQLRPAVLLHDNRIDRQLVDPLRNELAVDFPVVTHTDPLELKETLGNAKLVIGSRFHALAGALSLAVPTIAAGWSHKYAMLMQDYQCSEAILDTNADDERIAKVIQAVLCDAHLCERLRLASDKLRSESLSMWNQVSEVIERRSV